jgi:phosphate transport system substrate-binding protein
MSPLRTFALLAASLAAVAQQPPATTIRVCGSPQMADLIHRYETGFRKQHPNVRFEEDLQNTLTAVSGVSTNHADIGLLGRELWPTEAEAYTTTHGHPPTVIDIATGSYDVPKATFALMVFVPRANPIASLSTAQLARIFSATQPVKTWGELGLKGEWAARPIHLYGFQVANDKSQIFAQLIFAKNDRWNPTLHEFANEAGPNGADAGQLIVEAIAQDPNAIGISNVHYATAAVRALPLAPPGQPPILPSKANVASRRYPLTREVYMVLGDHPSPAAIEFLRFVLGPQGRQAVIEEGNYLPLPKKEAASQLTRLTAP